MPGQASLGSSWATYGCQNFGTVSLFKAGRVAGGLAFASFSLLPRKQKLLWEPPSADF